MSDIIYYDNEVVGMEVVMNEVESEVSPEGYIFVRNGEKEIDGHVENVSKPEINRYVEEKKSEISDFAVDKTAEAESNIDDYLNDTVLPALNQHTENKKQELSSLAAELTGTFEANAAEKQAAVDTSAEAAAASAAAAKISEDNAKASADSAAATVSGFDAHAAEKQSAYDENAAEKCEAYNANADARVLEFNNNFETKTSVFNGNYDDKLAAFNANAMGKTADFDANAVVQTNSANASIDTHKAEVTADFDANAVEKQSAVDASAAAAKVSEDNAKASEVVCQGILERLGTVIKIKGRVNSVPELPAEGNLEGDAYLVGEEGSENFAEYFWFSDHWEFLGTTGSKLSWGNITGEISSQADITAALNLKANQAEVSSSLNLKANLDSPAFSGTPTVPVPGLNDNSQRPITSSWFCQKIQVVDALPSSPSADIFYFSKS